MESCWTWCEQSDRSGVTNQCFTSFLLVTWLQQSFPSGSFVSSYPVLCGQDFLSSTSKAAAPDFSQVGTIPHTPSRIPSSLTFCCFLCLHTLAPKTVSFPRSRREWLLQIRQCWAWGPPSLASSQSYVHAVYSTTFCVSLHSSVDVLMPAVLCAFVQHICLWGPRWSACGGCTLVGWCVLNNSTCLTPSYTPNS